MALQPPWLLAVTATCWYSLHCKHPAIGDRASFYLSMPGRLKANRHDKTVLPCFRVKGAGFSTQPRMTCSERAGAAGHHWNAEWDIWSLFGSQTTLRQEIDCVKSPMPNPTPNRINCILLTSVTSGTLKGSHETHITTACRALPVSAAKAATHGTS
jgi:hypothetical protein